MLYWHSGSRQHYQVELLIHVTVDYTVDRSRLLELADGASNHPALF